MYLEHDQHVPDYCGMFHHERAVNFEDGILHLVSTVSDAHYQAPGLIT